MPKVTMTDAAVRRYKAGKTRVDYFDNAIPGFALRVSPATQRSPAGFRSWVLFYRMAGKQRRLTLGSYPETSLAEAREKAVLARRKVAANEDPTAFRRPLAAAASETVADVVDLFMRRYMEHGGRAHSPRYIDEVRRNFQNHVLPVWGGREMNSIRRRDVNALLDSIVDDGKPVAANRVLAALSRLFSWAISRDLIDASPVVRIERPGAETARERALSDHEIPAVWAAAAELGYPWGPYFRMLLTTGQRRSEVAGMRWVDIDKEAGVWTMPAAMTKSARAHVVPLSSLAINILNECPRAGTYVFTGRAGRPISGYSGAKKEIDGALTRSNVELDHWTIHDLRRTVGTGLGRLGISRFVIGRVLNHADNSVTGIYDRYQYLTEKRQALDAWADHVAALIR
jgi:integrase